MRPQETVRAGYDKIAAQYARMRRADSKDVQLLQQLAQRLPNGGTVLDAGCGSGYPVFQILADSFRVTGVDFSIEEVRLARKKVLGATVACADFTRLPFRDSTFNAVVSYYAIIHVPRDEHEALLRGFHRILKPDGLALLCMGSGDLPSDTGSYHGTPMFWSHFDGERNLRMMRDCGFTISLSQVIPDPIDPPSRHLFVLGHKE